MSTIYREVSEAGHVAMRAVQMWCVLSGDAGAGTGVGAGPGSNDSHFILQA